MGGHFCAQLHDVAWRARGTRLAARHAMETLELPAIPIPELPPLADLLADGNDRPRERLWRCGTQSLGDAELLAILLGTGVRARPALAVASDLVHSVGGVAALSRA